MAPSDTSTYRPTVLLLAGFVATLAALLIHQRRQKAEAPSSDTGLHRSNAVRRPNTRRPRHPAEPGSSGLSPSATVSEYAISRLLARDENGMRYGVFTPPPVMDTRVAQMLRSYSLIPSQLPTTTDLQSLLSMTEMAAQQTQREMHTDFMYSFMSQEYPSGHLIENEEAAYLCEQLVSLGIDIAVVQACIVEFNTGMVLSTQATELSTGVPSGAHLRRPHRFGNFPEPLISAEGANDTGQEATIQAVDTRETVVDDQSQVSHRNASDSEGEDEGHNVLGLVYRVAEDSARRENYVHRGVMCNGCRVQPIQGIRYSCANCPDYDLCEDCEAHQIHIKTHIFYKVRIPAPLLGYHRPTAPTWYPGKPHLLTEELRKRFPPRLGNELCRHFNLDHEELQAHWEQFICLAGCPWPEDPLELGLAIDRDGFDKCFCPPTSLRSPPPNLIYDRMFAFYDTNNDGRIGLEEFLKGLVNLKDTSREAQLQRIFRAYDMDNDGFVCRKDFLRLFRAYYSYSKEMAIASVAALDPNRDDPYARDADKDEVKRKVEGGRPISAIFDGGIPAGHASRTGSGKSLSPDANGDLIIEDEDGVLDEDAIDGFEDRGDIIGDAALSNRSRTSPFPGFRHLRRHALPPRDLVVTHPTDADATPSGSEAAMGHVDTEGVVNAPPQNTTVEEVVDPVERARAFLAHVERTKAEAEAEVDRDDQSIRQQATRDRWQRRKFYTDAEEGFSAPPGYVEIDSSDDDGDNEGHGDNGTAGRDSLADSRRQSLRSRSSSKVRFEDEVTDTEYEARSNTSSRSIPVGERWGGYEIRNIEQDEFTDVLYQAIQQGFNELLDQLFKEKEDLGVAADASRANRRKLKHLSSHDFRPKPASTLASDSGTADWRRRQVEEGGPVALPSESAQSSSSTVPDPTVSQNESDSVSELNADVATHPSTTKTPPSGRDPTMPQNRPESPVLPNVNVANHAPSMSSTPSPRAEERLASPDATVDLSQTIPPREPLSGPFLQPPVLATGHEASNETLTQWAQHDAIDAEAEKRGGHGRLNFDELATKMVEEVNSGKTRNDPDDLLWTYERAVYGDGEVGGEQKWGEKASMGRLWFVGTWIEQSSF